MRRAVFNMRDERPVWSPPAWVAERLRSALPPDWELVDVTAPVSGRGDGGGVSGEALSAMRGAEIYFGLGLPRELLLAGLAEPSALRWIHSGAAGVASLLHPELEQAGVTLTNSAGIHAPAMAETVLAMMLHFARGLDHAVRAQQHGRWNTAPFEARDSGIREVAGATLGIVGYGGIGGALARRARALGMTVLATRRRAAAAVTDRWRAEGEVDVEPDEVLTGADGLRELLGRADFVVLALPSTPATRGLIGAAELALLPGHAVLINVARGDIVDEAALADALQHRRLRGAALDVFATEPLPADSPLWRLDNVLVTPHVSATTPRFWEREVDLMTENLRRYAAGESLLNRVSAEAGY